MRGKSKTTRNLIVAFLAVFGVILLFTIADYFVHSLKSDYSVPPRYFTNKIIFGTLIGFFACLLVKKWNLFAGSIFFSAAVSILLQLRYLLEGYPLGFVFLFLGLHFIILLPLSALMLKLEKNLTKN